MGYFRLTLVPAEMVSYNIYENLFICFDFCHFKFMFMAKGRIFNRSSKRESNETKITNIYIPVYLYIMYMITLRKYT